MWNAENRPRYNRDKLRYPSDLTDKEWKLVEPLIPPAKRGGRRRSVDMRAVVNGLMYVLGTGCQWRYVPKDLPPQEHDLPLFWPVDLSRRDRSHPSRALRALPRAFRP